MSETIADSVTVNIDDMLKSSSFPPSKPLMIRVGDDLRSKPPMFRVDDDFRSWNPKDYDPKLIAIGPFHHGNSKLKEMEEHKKWYLKLLIERRRESSVESYVTTIRRLEGKARRCYAEDIQLDEDEFVQMLLLDGCFIIEFLHRCLTKVDKHEDDTIFKHEDTQVQLLHDLMLFENQIPFFIIVSLFEMIKIEDVDIKSLISPLLVNGIFPVDQQNLPPFPSNYDHIHHLLGIVHDIQCSSFEVAEMFSDWKGISSAVELKATGISFKRSEVTCSFFDIKFENKALIIPEWEVTDSTESLIQNLIAYEHYLPGRSKKYVTDYVHFIKCLVNSPIDEKLLIRSGIIGNKLTGSDEMVYRVIDRLWLSPRIYSDHYYRKNFSYSKIFNDVNCHYDNNWNIRIRRRMANLSTRIRRWMKILRKEYFSSPWKVISVLAAIILLVLTITQTTFAILSYRNDLKNGGRF